MSGIVFAVLLATYLFTQSMLVIPENERVVILRLGRCLGVVGPGIVFILPTVDKPFKFKLPKYLPEWQSLSPDDLKERVKNMVLNDTDPKRFAK